MVCVTTYNVALGWLVASASVRVEGMWVVGVMGGQAAMSLGVKRSKSDEWVSIHILRRL